MSEEHHPTYTTYLLHTIMPAPGWQVVYWQQDHHDVAPLHALALTTRHERDCRTNRIEETYWGEIAEDRRTLVGLEYNPSDGWEVVDQMLNYCGLLPPDWTLAQFEACRGCLEGHETKKVSL